MTTNSKSCLVALISTAFLLDIVSGDALAEDATHKSRLFQSINLVYEDNFDGDQINTDFWEIRQNSTWKIENGILHGSQSSPEFQKKKIAEGDRAHAGFKPVIWLKKVPENFVCAMRVRYDAPQYQKGFPLLDLGHHIHTLTFSEKITNLTVKKDAARFAVDAPRFSLNHWHDVVIELTKGKLLFQVDKASHVFEDPSIDMSGQAQIDFKAVDLGTTQIDSIKLWEGK
jgi:hypothetical protein